MVAQGCQDGERQRGERRSDVLVVTHDDAQLPDRLDLIAPEEIANMVVYLASDQASATTGGALRVDGGYVDHILP